MTTANSTSDLTTLSAEEQRVRAAIEGRRDAAESLLMELLPRVRNLVRYSVRRESEVDDITQEVLIAILRGLPSYRGEGAFAAWATRVAVRVTCAASRRVRAESSQRGGEEVEQELTAVPSEEALPDDCVLHRQMVKMMEQLSNEQRRVLVLHHMMGMSVPEMAEELKVPFETVRSRLRLARANLRELLCQ